MDEEETSLSAEENMALAKRLMEARVRGDVDALDEMLTPDFVTHTKLVSGQPPGREGEKWANSQLNSALSNRNIHFENQIAAGDKVASRFVVHVTHDREELMGVAPSGKVMTNKIIMIHRIERRKIAEEWSIGTLGLRLRGVRLEQEVRERERVDQELKVARRIQQAARIPPDMFVTCFYAIVDPDSGRVVYANAGHDLPYLRRRGSDCEELRARGMPLGLMPGMSYEEKEPVLDVGEAALFYTDGLVEAHDPQREMFGFPRLKALVAQHGDEERALGNILLEELYSFVGDGWEQEDDITLLTLRHSAPLSRTSANRYHRRR